MIKKAPKFMVMFLTLFTCLLVLTMGLHAQGPDEVDSQDFTSQEGSVIQKIVDPPHIKAEADQESESDVRRVAPTSTGGPDDFGYVYIDSNEAAGPLYQFVDLPTTNTNTIDFGDDSLHGPYSLGFDFNYYGTDDNQIWISSNGWLSVGSTFPGDSDYTNDCPLPATGGANNVIAGIWDDLQALDFPFTDKSNGYFESFAAGSCPYNGYAGACAVTQWDSMYHASGTTDWMTFEILLFDNHDILIQIADDGPEHGLRSTTGIENATGQTGLTYACNSNNSIAAPLAIKYSPPAPSPVYDERDNYVQAPYKVKTGEAFNYTLVISNTGSTDSASILISDTLPAEVTQTGAATVSQMSAGVSGGFINDFPAAGAPIQWSGAISAGNGLEINIPVQTNAGATSIFTNTVYMTDSAMSEPVELMAATQVYDADELFYYESFNSGPGAGVGNNEWEWGQAKYGPKQAHSPNGLWGTDLDAEYENGISNTLSMTIDLSTIPLTHTVMVQWWEWLETQSCCDFTSVKISSPSNPTPTTISGPSAGNSGGWVEKWQDISNYGGEVITLWFMLEPNVSVVDKGWFIDDVSIHRTVPLVPNIQLETTVGTDSSTCATTNTISVAAGTPVYYCYKVTNSGTLTLTQHDLVDSELGSLLSSLPLTLAPGAMVDTVSQGFTFNTTITTDTVNSAVWTASDGTLTNSVSLTDSATVTIGGADIMLEKTVGTDAGQCATTDTIQVVSGTAVYYCYRVTNVGVATLHLHDINDNLLGNVIPNLPYTLLPGESFTNVDLNLLVSSVITTDTVNTTTWTAYNPGPTNVVSATDTTTVTLGSLGIELTKTVGTQSGVCASTDTITVTKGTLVTYCYEVTNTSDLTVSLHTLNDNTGSNLFNGMPYELAPGESVSNFDFNIPIQSIINTTTTSIATWTAYNAGPIDMVVASDATTVIVSDPMIELKKTVGTVPGVCATTDIITVTLGTTVYYCYEVTNQGNVPLALHTLEDTTFGNLFTGFAHNLAPGESTNSVQAGFTVSETIQGNTVNLGTWTAYNNGPTDVAEASDITQVFVHNPRIELKMTVGTAAGVCATTDTITVIEGSTVYYCYEVTNTGNVPLASHSLTDTQLGQPFTGFAHNLAPGESTNSVQAGFTISATVNSQSIHVGTWSAYNSNPTDTVVASDFANVIVLRSEIEVVQTVGIDAGVCATTDAIEVSVGTTVYYCYEVSNTGDVSLDFHSLYDDQPGNLFTGFAHTLAPGETINNIQMGMPLTMTVSANKTNIATWAAYNNGPTNVITATDSTLIIAKQLPTSIQMSTFHISKTSSNLPLNILMMGMMLLASTAYAAYRRHMQ